MWHKLIEAYNVWVDGPAIGIEKTLPVLIVIGTAALVAIFI